jgi:hypothetical protein
MLSCVTLGKENRYICGGVANRMHGNLGHF